MVSALRSELASLLTTKHEVEAYRSALVTLAGSYAPQLGASTDFAAELEAIMQRVGGRFDPKRSQAMRDFDEAAGTEANGGGGGGDDEDDDEDVVDVGGGALNATCPISGRNIYDLEDPVEDQVGYVYERSAIEQHIRIHAHGCCDAPFPGVSHRITIAGLKKSTKVLNQQRRRRLGLGAQQRRGGQGGRGKGGGEAEEVIDV
ncbi:hypothetical protein MNEG_6995 [Monoraphidium neglectum]|uniref:U-box domain-containing protein n=1 Tax=Monoraphidium neglectum TaxID=145388 RepID=A0A0D2JP93_9CHLO|nr:hypothetical protein MNEG_6995 [Monoraphidium neglectum]KIZ00968.1 hypothetical protein MNEG_6995 [Monoraphidium neglectum]|eukprot:XP_013899987.1 hypothetical protein MNEG_6995 [Monoraphidium neglectum]